MAQEIVNRVANSSLITFDIADYYPKGDRKVLDISQWLEEGFLLREKEFRSSLADFDFSSYKDSYVALQCSTKALLPAWATLLVTAYLQPMAKRVVFGSLAQLEETVFNEIVSSIDWQQFSQKPVIIKGCTEYNIPENVYIQLVQKLQPIVKRLSYGEACSSVPLYKK